MIENISKYRLLYISLFLIIWSLFTETPFQKGGIDNYMHYVIFIIIIFVGFLFILPYQYPKFIPLEKILYPIISAFIGLATSLIGTNVILEFFYGFDYQLNLSNLISNLIFYFLATITSIGSLYIVVKIKK